MVAEMFLEPTELDGFEKFGKDALRILYLTRKKVTECGGLEIGPAHLLLALLEGDPEATRFIQCGTLGAEELLARLKSVNGERTPPLDLEVPVSSELERVLAQARTEAESLHHETVRPGHLMLALAIGTKHGTVARPPECTLSPPETIRASLRSSAL